ncbi:MAG: IPT/TIG domain-containing protein, partial [Chloroflexota bacterium]
MRYKKDANLSRFSNAKRWHLYTRLAIAVFTPILFLLLNLGYAWFSSQHQPLATGFGAPEVLFAQVVTGTATLTPTSEPPTNTPTSVPPTNTPTAVPPTNTPVPTAVVLSLSGVEPSRMSTLTGGILSVYGNGFSEATIVRLVGYGILETTFINENTLTAVVPPNVPPDKYDVQVGNGNISGSGAILGDAFRIDDIEQTPEPTNTPVPTITPTPTASPVFVFGQPQLLVQSASTNPSLLQPEQPFELTMALANLGNYVAIDITVQLQSTDIAVPAAGSNVRIIQRIGVEASETITLPLVLSDTAGNGPQNLTFDLTYFDINGRSYNSQQNVGLNVGNTTPTPTPTPESDTQPRIVLTTYLVEPEAELRPGGIFQLTLNLTNVGDGPANNIVQTLGGENGASLQPFALLNSSNVRFIDGLEAGETIEITQQMIVAGTADSGVFNLPLSFTYNDASGTERTDNQVVNLLVQKQPQLTVDFYRSVLPGLVDEPLDLPIEVVNIGRSLVNISTISLNSPDLSFENGSAYIGPLDGGTSGSLDGLAIPNAGGDLDVTVTVNYLDDFNQPQTFVQTLSVSVEEPF